MSKKHLNLTVEYESVLPTPLPVTFGDKLIGGKVKSVAVYDSQEIARIAQKALGEIALKIGEEANIAKAAIEEMRQVSLGSPTKIQPEFKSTKFKDKIT